MAKRPVKILTDAEKIKEQIDRHYTCDRDFKVNEPTRTFEVGEMVVYGRHPNAVVVQVLDDGKYYILKTWGEYKHYGNMVYGEGFTIQPWHDLYKVNKVEVPNFSKTDYERLNYSQRCISGLFTMYYGSGVDMNPDYQRDFVWFKWDKVNLIESIFDNVDIGKFVFVHKKYKDNEPSYEILDGKQRLNALIEFYEDRFTYKGLKFSELSNRDQNHIENYPISYAEVGENVSREGVINIFIKVNTCGRVMDKDHLEKVKGMIK